MKSGYTVTEMSLSFAILYTRVYHYAVGSMAKNKETPSGCTIVPWKARQIEEIPSGHTMMPWKARHKIGNTLRVYHDAVGSTAKNKEMGEVAWRY